MPENTSSSQKGRIFISYRRADSAGYAGRIYDRLVANFGDDAIFMDVDTIEGGTDFITVLEDAVQSCDVLIALIGRQWLSIKDKDGKRRLDNPEDFVRIEIATALKRNIRVIPVLVDGVDMPQSNELPENLKALSRRNALQVNHHSFNPDVYRLIEHTKSALDEAEISRVMKAQAAQVAREKAEREAAEKAAREKTEREAFELAERERKEKELREKQAREARGSEKPAPVKPKAGSQIAYWFGGFIILVLGIILLSSLNNPPSTPQPTPEPTTVVSTPTNTKTPSPSATRQPATPTFTSTSVPPTFTSTPGIGSFIKSDGVVMMFVPSEPFSMGSDRYNDEQPIHPVRLSAYYIDKYEVTNAAYQRCVDAGACVLPKQSRSYTRIAYYGNPEFDEFPVIYVDWNMAKTYCEWRGDRLPTEAEWEKAARGTDGRTYPWGESVSCDKANYQSNCKGDTTQVGSYLGGVSPYGLYDMAGNVWEWTSSLFKPYPYSVDDGREILNASGVRVPRGGSWNNYDFNARSSYRYRLTPDYINYNVGFRCARSLP
jgi:formylglycine-generating enzyme required for sulfatase activity